MLSFDTSAGKSLGKNNELFAVKSWSPFNSIKLYSIDFDDRALLEIYEIPLPKDKFERVVDVQLVKISDQNNTYIVYLDMNEAKEIYQLNFEIKEKSKWLDDEGFEAKYQVVNKFESKLSNYKTFLVAKYLIKSPFLKNSIVKINQHE